ncbi:MAG: DNA gyrase subunit A, partial [Alphaproteobacteria bacterium]|nr:DNA gyrase subunit A [Alphaproteobacteria bacterium]
RDGLKPVHRRILWAMKEAGLAANRGFTKSAHVVGDVIGKYHPHGDVAIYDAMVRMAQTFSMRDILVSGQGNFGSLDGDPPAAYRYTEAKLSELAEHLLNDLDKDTVDFQENYDGRTVEPTVLPAEFPNLLVNGAGGIAVGMATNIPPHNLGEVIDACCALIDMPDLSDVELHKIVPGPDFPTGCTIINPSGVREAALTGRGSIYIRAKAKIETIRKDREAIIVTETPYQVNKAKLLERIAELVHDKTIEGISDLRDESDRDGTRIVVELKRDAVAELVLKQLYRHSNMQVSFGVNALALWHGKPEMLTLRQMLQAFLTFREEVITRRLQFLLNKARDRAHILVGLAVAVANIDDVIAIIRAAADPNQARVDLMARSFPIHDLAALLALVEGDDSVSIAEGGATTSEYYLSEAQARGILELRLQRLTGLERDKIISELREISGEIRGYLQLLGSRPELLALMRRELVEIKARFATPRRTLIESLVDDEADEAFIAREAMVVTVTQNGYIKRTSLSTYRAQRRGGKGRSGMATREEDFVTTIFVTDTHTPILFFSTAGRAFELKVWRLPEGTPQSRGKPMVNLLPLEEGESIATIMPLPEPDQRDGKSIFFATSKGEVRRNALADFLDIRANGKIAMKLIDENGESLGRLIGVAVCEEHHDILLATRLGRAIRFSVTDVRVFNSRNSTGVRGIRLASGDELVSLSVIDGAGDATSDERAAYLRQAQARRAALTGEDAGEIVDIVDSDDDGDDAEVKSEQLILDDDRFNQLAARENFILSVTELGFGKRTSSYAYRTTKRGGKGIANMKITEKNGQVVANFPVVETDQIMLATDGGQILRTNVDSIRLVGRASQGVTVLRVGDGEHVVSVSRFDGGEGAEDEGSGEVSAE